MGVLVKALRDAVDGLLLAAIAGERRGDRRGAGSGGGGSDVEGGGPVSGGKVLDTIRRLLAEAEDQAARR